MYSLIIILGLFFHNDCVQRHNDCVQRHNEHMKRCEIQYQRIVTSIESPVPVPVIKVPVIKTPVIKAPVIKESLDKVPILHGPPIILDRCPNCKLRKSERKVN